MLYIYKKDGDNLIFIGESAELNNIDHDDNCIVVSSHPIDDCDYILLDVVTGLSVHDKAL